jgi:hypothetical protein
MSFGLYGIDVYIEEFDKPLCDDDPEHIKRV